MRPVNLIPPDERRGDSAPLRTGPLVYVLVGAMGLLLLGIVGVALTSKTVSDREAKKANLQQELAQAKAQADSVQAFTQFAQVQQNRASTVSSLATSRFDWQRVLHEMSLILPAGVSLNSLKGTVSPDVQVSGTGGGSSSSSGTDLRSGIEGPALEIAGCAPTQDMVASFVAALEEIDGVTRVGLESSGRSTQSAGSQTGEPPAEPTGGQNGCDPTFYSFSIMVAFDKVPPPGTAAPTPPAPSTAAPASDNPAGEVQSQNNIVKTSLNQKSERAHNVIHAIGGGG